MRKRQAAELARADKLAKASSAAERMRRSLRDQIPCDTKRMGTPHYAVNQQNGGDDCLGPTDPEFAPQTRRKDLEAPSSRAALIMLTGQCRPKKGLEPSRRLGMRRFFKNACGRPPTPRHAAARPRMTIAPARR